MANKTGEVAQGLGVPSELFTKYAKLLDKEIADSQKRLDRLNAEREQLARRWSAPDAAKLGRRSGARTATSHVGGGSPTPKGTLKRYESYTEGATVLDRVLAVMNAEPGRRWKAREIAEATGCSGVATNLHRAAQRGLCRKVGPGEFQSATTRKRAR